MTTHFFNVKASENGTKFHLEIEEGLMYVLTTISVLNGECIVSFEIEDDESDDNKMKEIYIARLCKTIPTELLHLEFDLQYVDFIVRGTGEVYFNGYNIIDPRFRDYKDEDIEEGGFEMNIK
ncbi:hypothetical protein EDI_143740 [Entamoeba dispar SAW760]|uniref:Nucleoplasmin-like domain-containing protein n=1 Tax=Entamoeba dispar (strain ATCC PRA-260 / SAW760) TaxID=370354 RepID=B0EQY6_ENTDS|nr:uncharacterized protein EDI_143740 [Entamoeba dispar SAW760]EDR23062.1 hypothetical protein EDI_143740 [Entamoeba dispar SAW760]|eukprot:EDR23062.1 hypothetical protein EDI_143740 [Entamoeba dispar SAW760]